VTLNFPSVNRRFDPRRNLVRFWGYDSALEIPFFIEVSALYKLHPQTGNTETGYLKSFDSVRDRIHEAAAKAYKRGGKRAYVLSSADFDRDAEDLDVKANRPQSKEIT
jgi:Protein of unknown function (DUF1488)